MRSFSIWLGISVICSAFAARAVFADDLPQDDPLKGTTVHAKDLKDPPAATQPADRPQSASDKPPAKSAHAGEAPEAKKPAMFDDLNSADRLVFLCDTSGSMINKMAVLRDQVEKALPVLTPHQLFGIIFFQDTDSDMRNEKLLPATPENLRKAESRFEGFTPLGPMNPIPGIEAAFKLEPQVIYLVTDGDFPDNEAVLKIIRKLDKDKKVKVYTIAFVGKDDTDTDFIALLKIIADETGGKYKRVNADEL
ncbi:MAG TPA: hypothetical protein VFE47_12165 [Tepidisphaeraceae bacterium]|jgi:hypothetical protein|nr:hypothetical protein [Tepidisphaeraceae bacterium]